MKKFSVFIVDDHPIVLEGLCHVINTMEEFYIIGTALSAEKALHWLSENAVDIVITDIHLPRMSGIELTAEIKKKHPHIHVLGMSTFSDRSYVSEMIRNGASGYLTKNSDSEEIKNTLLKILKGEWVIGNFSNESPKPVIQSNDGPLLTRREKEVLHLIAQGLTNKEIADKIHVSTTTVDSHRKNLLQKFSALNSAALIAQASKLHFLE
jgi:two-component system, NarL family, nitrate/nitrite response regulator NarL